VYRYEELQDCMRQLALHDPDVRVADAAECYLADRSWIMLDEVIQVSEESPYRRRLMSTYAAYVVDREG
jgi:hypothetical protein